MKCPHCQNRYAWNTCPAGQDKHIRAVNEVTPDGQPIRLIARLPIPIEQEHMK